MNKLSHIVLLIFLSFYLTACGDDKGGEKSKDQSAEDLSHEQLMREAEKLSNKDDSDYWDFSDPDRKQMPIDGSSTEAATGTSNDSDK